MSGKVLYLRRPGKDHGVSASFNHNGSGLFYNFSTAAAPFEANTAYSKFAVLAMLEHNGDFHAAAKALAEQGYGQPQTGKPPATDPRIQRTLPPVPEFPLAVLSAEVRAFVVSAAATIGCPVEFVILPLLALAEGVMGNRRRLLIRAGHTVLPGSWFLPIGESGTGKTPGAKYALRIPKGLIEEAWERYNDALKAWLQTPKEERDTHPTLERYVSTDNTKEGLNRALMTSPGVTQVEDEARRLWKSFDAYHHGAERQHRLSLWSNSLITIERATQPPLYIPEPVVPLIGGLQPGVLPTLRGEATDGFSDDGWLPRFLAAWPDAEPPPLSDVAFDPETEKPVIAIFTRLRCKDAYEHRLSEEAWPVYKTWHETNRQHQLVSQGIERQWAAKAPDHLARLILDLHVLEPGNVFVPEVSAQTVRDAITLLEYFREHLARVLPALGIAVVGTVESRILRLLTILAPDDGWVRRSALYERLGNVKAEAFEAALSALLAARKIEARTEPGATKPATSYRIARSQIPNIYGQPVDNGNNGNWESGVDAATGEITGNIAPPRHRPVPPGCTLPEGCQRDGPCLSFLDDGHCRRGREDDEPP